MKNFKPILLIAAFIGFASCSDDNDDVILLQIETETISNIHAPQEGGIDPNTGQPLPVSGEFAKFDISTGQVTNSETDWDIAFRGTLIIVNGGESFGATDEPERTGNAAVYIENGTMTSVENVNTSLLKQDSANGYAITTGSGNGWYSYAGPPSHLITPIAGKILVVRTRDGKYAKIEILSYYKDAPENPDAYQDEDKYYTFNVVFQPNEGVTTFE